MEDTEGKSFLVLELVEGQTLAEKLQSGSLPIDDALEIGRQIAEGLDSAHERGIIHRDLKPGNVMITPEGQVKILYFGLAKAFQDEVTPVDISKSPTITDEMTRPGIVLGTAAYMSPEQAKGKPVDKRADIWAFGCLLFECLAGVRPFPGEGITDTIAKILESEPNWALLPPGMPAQLRALLEKCLTKEELPFPADAFGTFSLSPDGGQAAVTVSKGGIWNIWIYDLVRNIPRRLTLEGDNYAPIWTPDGEAVTFSSDRSDSRNLFTKAKDGTADAVQVTRDQSRQLPTSWSSEGEHLLVDEISTQLWDIALLSALEDYSKSEWLKTRFNEWGAVFSPDDRYIAYTSNEQGSYEVWVQPHPQTGERWQLSSGGGEEPVWSSASRELFYRDGRKWMVVSYETDPEFTPAAPRLLFEGEFLNVGARSYDVSLDGQRFLLIRPIEGQASTAHLKVILNWQQELSQAIP